MYAIWGKLAVTLGLIGLGGCVADGGYGPGPGYGGPAYGGVVGYEQPIYRGYEPRGTYIEPGRGYGGGGYRPEQRYDDRRPQVRDERRQAPREERRQPSPPPREERRPSPGIRAPFERSSAPAQAPRYSGPADARQGPTVSDREGGR